EHGAGQRGKNGGRRAEGADGVQGGLLVAGSTVGGGKWCSPRITACTTARTNPWRWACSGGGGRPGGSWLRRSAGDYGLWQVLAAVSAGTPAPPAAPGQTGGEAGGAWPPHRLCKNRSPRAAGPRARPVRP